MKHVRTPWRRSLLRLCAFALIVILAGCAVSRNPVTGNKRAYGYTWQQEIELGRQSDQQILQQYGVYDNAEVQRYVERIGQEVLAESHLRRPDAQQEFRETEFTFRVLDSPVVNAFALPGGYVYVTRGLLSHLNNEAQLAVVLGHEIGHVAARHASKRAFEAQAGQIGLLGAAIGGGILGGGQVAENILNVGSQATQLLLLSYGRDDERESDDLGVEYSALAGYEAAEGAAFFRTLERLSAQQGDGLPSFLSTHPDPGEREQTIIRKAAEWEQTTQMTEVNREAYLGIIDGMIIGDNPRQGFVENGRFYHPDLEFFFPVPRGFGLQNQYTQVVMVEQNQQAAMVFTFAEESSAQAAARAFASQQGLTVAESGAAESSGYPAYYVLAEANSQGQQIGVLAYFVEYGGQVYAFVGYAPAQSFGQYRNEFLQTMRGFDRLTDRSLLNVQPTRLRMTPARQTAAFRSLLPSRLPGDWTAEELAILNQTELNETIQSGTLLKLPAQ